MRIQDEIRVINERHWERMVKEGCGFTRPWLNLDRTLIFCNIFDLSFCLTYNVVGLEETDKDERRKQNALQAAGL